MLSLLWNGLGRTYLEVHIIDTRDAALVKYRHYPVSPAVVRGWCVLSWIGCFTLELLTKVIIHGVIRLLSSVVILEALRDRVFVYLYDLSTGLPDFETHCNRFLIVWNRLV